MKTMDILKQLRKSKGFSQKIVAEQIGITQTAYTKYESGLGNVPTRRLQKLAALYNVSVDYLLGNENASSTEEAAGTVSDERLTDRELKHLQYYRLLDSSLQVELDNYLMFLVTKNENLPPPPAKSVK